MVSRTQLSSGADIVSLSRGLAVINTAATFMSKSLGYIYSKEFQ